MSTKLCINSRDICAAQALPPLLHDVLDRMLLTRATHNTAWRLAYLAATARLLASVTRRLVVHHVNEGDMGRKETRVSYLIQQEGRHFHLYAAQQDSADCAFECVSSVLLHLRPPCLIKLICHVCTQKVSTISSHA